jgi:hypothetical protein
MFIQQLRHGCALIISYFKMAKGAWASWQDI